MGKAYRLYAPPSTTIYTTAFELIQTDLWGPAPFTSSSGYTYYITFVDAYTRFTLTYFLKNNFEALTAFKQFHSLLTMQFSAHIKALQFDWKIVPFSRLSHWVRYKS